MMESSKKHIGKTADIIKNEAVRMFNNKIKKIKIMLKK